MEFVKDIAAVVGCVSSCIALLTTVCKPIRKAIVEFIAAKSGKSETQAKLEAMSTQIDALSKMVQEHRDADVIKQERMDCDREALLCLLRNAITRKYYKYLPKKAIPAYEYKNVILLNEAYVKEHGNTYVATIVEDIRNDWTVLPD